MNALRATIGVTLSLAILLIFPNIGLSLSFTIGAWSAGISLLVPDVRRRPSLPFIVGLAVGIALLLGGLTTNIPILAIIVAASWAWLLEYISIIGPAVAAVTTACGIAFVLAPAFTTHVSPYSAALGAVLGSLLQVATSVFLPQQKYQSERHAIADAYRSVSKDAYTLSNAMNAALPTDTILGMKGMIGKDRKLPQALRESADQLFEVRATVIAVAASRARMVGNDPLTAAYIAKVLVAAADVMEQFAASINRLTRPEETWDAKLDAIIDAAPSPSAENGPPAHWVAGQEIRRLHRSLHQASLIIARIAEGEPAVEVVPRRVRVRSRIREDWHSLQANFTSDSPAMRHSARAALTIGIATTLGMWWPGPGGQWIALTAWIALRVDFAATIGRGLQNVIGTVLGAGIAAVLSYYVSSDIGISAVVAGFAFAAYTAMPVSFMLYSAGVAGFSLFQLNMAGFSAADAALSRDVATVVGGALALVVFFVWPTWQSKRLGDLLSDLIIHYGENAKLVLTAQINPSKADESTLKTTVDSIRLSRSKLETAAKQAPAEPIRTSPPYSMDVLDANAALSRAARALIVIHNNTPSTHEPEIKELEPFTNKVVATYRDMAETIRSRQHSVTVNFDDALEALDKSRDSSPGDTRRGRVLRWECDIIAEALSDTAFIINDWQDSSHIAAARNE